MRNLKMLIKKFAPVVRLMTLAALALPAVGGAMLVVTWSSDGSGMSLIAGLVGGGIALIVLAAGARVAWQHYQTLRNEVRSLATKLGRTAAAETALRNQLAFADLVFDTASTMLIVQDPAGRVLKSNARGRDVFGVEKILSGEPEVDLTIRDGDGESIAADRWPQKLRASTTSIETPYELQRGSDPATWVAVSSAPVHSPSGALAGTVLSVRDVTGSMPTRGGGDARAQRAMSVITDGVWELSPKTGKAFFSTQFQRMLGYEPGELTETIETWNSVIHPDDLERMQAVRDASVERGGHFNVECRMRCRDGTYRFVHTVGRALRDVAGTVETFHGASRDVTEARELQAAVERARAEAVAAAREMAIVRDRYRLALDGGELITWEWDIASGKLTMSDRWQALSGYQPDEIAQIEAWSGLLHADDLTRYRLIVDAHDAGERDFIECDCRIRAKNESWVWLRVRGRIVARGPSGEAITVAGTYLDLTPLKQAEDALNHAGEAAETARRARSQFLADLSHEIRTPLTAIMGFAELLLDNALDPADRREHLDTIRRNGQELLTTITEVVDFSRLDSDSLAVKPLPVEPGRIVGEVVDLLHHRAIDKGLELKATISPEASRPIVTDPARLRQVLVNLIAHSIETTPTGSITITCGVSETNQLSLEIVDTGIGMTDSQREAIFRPFARGDGISHTVTAAGLGLAIAWRLAKLLGGDLSASGQPGQGSRFGLTLPMTCPAQPGRDPHAVAADIDAIRGIHVLVAEDGIDQQRLIRFFLQRLGVTHDVVSDGRAAVDAVIAAPQKYSAILMDMQMPVMDGYAATAELRRRNIGMPIVAVTAATTSAERDRCVTAGCTDFLAKPTHSADLALVLRRVIVDVRRAVAA